MPLFEKIKITNFLQLSLYKAYVARLYYSGLIVHWFEIVPWVGLVRVQFHMKDITCSKKGPNEIFYD